MILAYRLTGERFKDSPTEAMNGAGGLYGPGRWHPRGHRIVYLAQSLSLCTLEMKVQDSGLKPCYAGFEVAIPETVSRRTLDQSQLPLNWRDRMAYPACQALGEAWLTGEAETALLFVPSAVIPTETNCLLNPAHPDASQLVVRALGLLATDPRLLRGAG